MVIWGFLSTGALVTWEFLKTVSAGPIVVLVVGPGDTEADCDAIDM